MKNKLILTGIGALILLIAVGYFVITSQYGAKKLGGTHTIKLADNTKLVNVTWKEDELWLLTKKSSSSDVSETYEFKEDAKFNVIEGKVVIKENIK